MRRHSKVKPAPPLKKDHEYLNAHYILATHVCHDTGRHSYVLFTVGTGTGVASHKTWSKYGGHSAKLSTMYQIQTTSPTKFKMATFVDPWIAEEVVVSTALHKEHEIKAPGTSDILSVAEFKAECTADRLHLGQLKSKESEAINAALSEEMGIPTDALKQIQEVCK